MAKGTLVRLQSPGLPPVGKGLATAYCHSHGAAPPDCVEAAVRTQGTVGVVGDDTVFKRRQVSFILKPAPEKKGSPSS